MPYWSNARPTGPSRKVRHPPIVAPLLLPGGQNVGGSVCGGIATAGRTHTGLSLKGTAASLKPGLCVALSNSVIVPTVNPNVIPDGAPKEAQAAPPLVPSLKSAVEENVMCSVF